MISVRRTRVERADGVGRIALCRPEKKNALDQATAVELYDAIRDLGAADDVRAIVLTADGPDFCAGADLEALEQMLDAGPDAHRRDAEALARVFALLREVPKPVVAVVRGRALAGGAGLATACDIVLAHAGAQFGYPEVRVGFVPAMVMTMLRRSLGEKRAFDLVATGRILDARQAVEAGLATRWFDDASFEAGVTEVVTALVKAPPAALGLTKRLFYALDSLDFGAGLERGISVNVEARATDDFRAGVRRFVQTSRERG